MSRSAVVEGVVGTAYRGCRSRISEILSTADEAAARSPVPTCPGWSVHDVLAHLSGGMVDAVNGRLDGAGTDAWTALQVEARRDWPLARILDEWDEHASKIEPRLDSAGEIGRQAVADAVSHEHDVRAALDTPGARQTDAVRIGLAFAAARVIGQAEACGESLRIESDGMAFGPGDALICLRGPAFELLRATTGRRSVVQITALDWEGDTSRVIQAFWWAPLSPAVGDIYE